MDIITPSEAPQPPVERRGGEETRRRLLDSAVEVFADRGYHAATLSEIAARAGLTTGAVYSTFGSKRALLIAACSEAAGDGGTGAALSGASSLRAALEGLALDSARNGLNPATLRLLKMQVEVLKLGLREPQVLSAMAVSGRQQLESASRLIEELAAREGTTLPMPARELAILLSAMLNGLGLIQLVDRDAVPERLFLQGLDALMGWEPRARGRKRTKG